MATTISKIVKNIYGDQELIQLIVPDGWGVRVVPQPKSPYAIWRRTALHTDSSHARFGSWGNDAMSVHCFSGNCDNNNKLDNLAQH